MFMAKSRKLFTSICSTNDGNLFLINAIKISKTTGRVSFFKEDLISSFDILMIKC